MKDSQGFHARHDSEEPTLVWPLVVCVVLIALALIVCGAAREVDDPGPVSSTSAEPQEAVLKSSPALEEKQ